MNTTRRGDSRSHPPFPKGATAREVQAVQDLHHVADRHQEPEVRRALSGVVERIVERISRRGRDARWDQP
jgi:hypothetical protein